MSERLARFLTGEEGATMVEYALMVALIAASLVGIVTTLKTSISGKFSSVSTTLGGS